ncbi:MAG: alpha/beta hydrolase, partial [Chitinophagaceae bacterium]
MKKIYLFSVLGLALFPVLQNNIHYQPLVKNLNSAGQHTSEGGVEMTNATSDSLKQSLACISAELASHGITMQFESLTNSLNFSSQKSVPKFYNVGSDRLDLPKEKNQSKFIFNRPTGYNDFFHPLDPSGVNHEFYKQKFSILLKPFSYKVTDKIPTEKSLGISKSMNDFTIAKEKQIREGISKITKNKIEGNPCDSTAFNCSWDPRDSIFASADIIKSSKVYYGKNHFPTTIPGFYDVAYAQDNASELIDDYHDFVNLPGCPTGYSCSQLDSSLYYFVYYPRHIYTNCPLPVVFLFHAGGFSDCSQLNYENDFCIQIAQKGFIVINVEYRRGRIKDLDQNGKYTSVQQMMATYRGCQDGRGALRTAILDQRNIATNNIPYRIDTNNIFIAGQSAGGLIACNVANYTTQGQIDSIFPSPAGSNNIFTALGPIDADFYRGTTDINFHDKIKALWCMWGAYGIPISTSKTGTEYEFLSRNGTALPKPMIGFMGAKDPVFSPQKKYQYVIYPPIDHEPYVTEENCLPDGPYKVFSVEDKRALRFECTNDMFNILKAHNIPSMVFIDCDMYHGLQHDPDKNAPLSTNFNITSVSPTTLAVINNYMASRFTFFARVVYYNLDLYSGS